MPGQALGFAASFDQSRCVQKYQHRRNEGGNDRHRKGENLIGCRPLGEKVQRARLGELDQGYGQKQATRAERVPADEETSIGPEPARDPSARER